MELNKSRLCSSCVIGRTTWRARTAPLLLGVAKNPCVQNTAHRAGDLGYRAMNTNRVDS
jgi:hypothetical protein